MRIYIEIFTFLFEAMTYIAVLTIPSLKNVSKKWLLDEHHHQVATALHENVNRHHLLLEQAYHESKKQAMAEIDCNVSEMRKPFTRLEEISYNPQDGLRRTVC